jgi:hypothetical protein
MVFPLSRSLPLLQITCAFRANRPFLVHWFKSWQPGRIKVCRVCRDISGFQHRAFFGRFSV